MSLSIGIVGLPNVGKSTLFNALLKKQQALVAGYPFTTIEPNVGIVPVPDPTLEKLKQTICQNEKLSADFKVVPATVKFVDIAGLVEGAHRGEGLGNRFLAHVRETDAVLLLARAFQREEVVWSGPPAVEEQFRILTNELKEAGIEKPALYVVNGEKAEENEFIFINAQTGEGLEQLIRAAYQLLSLITFYSYNEKELRAWPILRGTKAPQAASQIHTDFEKGFIKAEVIAAEKFLTVGSWQKAREKGLLRQEGKEYEVQSEDLVYFKTRT